MDLSSASGRLGLAALRRLAVPTLSFVVLVLGHTLAPTRAHAQSPAALSLTEAMQLATLQSRGLAAVQFQVQAAQEMAVSAGQRSDPVLKLGINNLPIDGADRFSLTRDFMTMRSVGVMQELTRSDKRQARAARSEREADVARAAGQQLLAELRRDVALAWLERSFQQSMHELLLAQQVQAQAQVQAAEAQYRGGRGTQADVFVARSQVEIIADRGVQTDRMLKVAAVQLARWIGDAAARQPDTRPVFERPTWSDGDLAAHLTRHPQVGSAASREALAQAEVNLAAANKSADWSVELMFNQRGPAYSNMVSVNLSLPLQWDQKQRQDRELAAKQALLAQSGAERQEAQRAHEADVRAMLVEWRSHEERLRRYDTGLLPLALQRSEAALAAYRAGSGNLVGVLDARRSETEIRIDRLRIELDIARLWAQLTYLIPAADGAAAVTGARSTP